VNVPAQQTHFQMAWLGRVRSCDTIVGSKVATGGLTLGATGGRIVAETLDRPPARRPDQLLERSSDRTQTRESRAIGHPPGPTSCTTRARSMVASTADGSFVRTWPMRRSLARVGRGRPDSLLFVPQPNCRRPTRTQSEPHVVLRRCGRAGDDGRV
jgi:hypothetical protein